MTGALGDVVSYGGGLGFAPWLTSALGLVAVGIVALLTSKPSNDDDDSSPGGGIMQPVA